MLRSTVSSRSSIATSVQRAIAAQISKPSKKKINLFSPTTSSPSHQYRNTQLVVSSNNRSFSTFPFFSQLKPTTPTPKSPFQQKLFSRCRTTVLTAPTTTAATTTAVAVAIASKSSPALALITPNSIPSMHQSPFEIDLDEIETVKQFYAQFSEKTPEQIFPSLPVYTLDQVKSSSRITSAGSERIIVIQGDYIYDVTDFVATHPGGDRILQANFDMADPFWILYPIHHESAIVWQVLNEYRIGVLGKTDREEAKKKLKVLEEEAKKNNMWKYEPNRSKNILRFLSTTPCNAETPLHLIPNEFLTPSNYFFIRNHHPTPVSSFPSSNFAPADATSPTGEKNVNNRTETDECQTIITNQYDIEVDSITNTWFLPHKDRHKYPLSFEIDKKLYDNGLHKGKTTISLPIKHSKNITSGDETTTKDFDLKYDPTTGSYKIVLTIGDLEALLSQHEVTSTIICSGNRRNEMNVQTNLKTDGLSWGLGALSTGSFQGFKLSEIYNLFGVDYLTIQPTAGSSISQDSPSHCVIRAMDAPFDTSIPLARVMDPQKDVILALDMNGEPLSPDQGYPIKLIAPGCTGNRHVKWVSSISIGFEEAKSPWHMSTPYRHTGPATQAGRSPQESPNVYFWPVFSSITSPFGDKNRNKDPNTVTDPPLNPSQELIPTPATVNPHQCLNSKTIGSLKAQLLRQPALLHGSNLAKNDDDRGNKMTLSDQGLDDFIAKTFRCIDLSGYAYVGNGIGISRVDTAVVGVDGGKMNDQEEDSSTITYQIQPRSMLWTEAALTRGPPSTPNPPLDSTTATVNNHWAWVLWKSEVVIPANTRKDDVLTVSSKAVDFMANSQPQFIEPMWNSRGILDNAWCQYPVRIGDDEKRE